MYSSFGSDEYIQEVVTTHSKTLLRAAYSVVGSTHDAEEIVQETFIKLLDRDQPFNDGEHERAWLIRVTVNLAKNRKQSAWNRHSAPLEEWIPAHDEDFCESYALRQVMEKLQPNYRAVLHLYYYEGYKVGEISSMLDIPLATVSSRLARGREKLRTAMEGGQG